MFSLDYFRIPIPVMLNIHSHNGKICEIECAEAHEYDTWKRRRRRNDFMMHFMCIRRFIFSSLRYNNECVFFIFRYLIHTVHCEYIHASCKKNEEIGVFCLRPLSSSSSFNFFLIWLCLFSLLPSLFHTCFLLSCAISFLPIILQ